MIGISEEEENELDNLEKKEEKYLKLMSNGDTEEADCISRYLYTKRNNTVFKITRKSIICYGEIDFNTDSDDFNIIEQMNWLGHLGIRGIDIPSHYDYKTHTAFSPHSKPLWFDTTNPALVAQYIHGVLNKPKRCCIFREKFIKKFSQWTPIQIL